MRYQAQHGTIYTDERTFRQFGGLSIRETGEHSVTVDLEFRLATNGVIVNTIANGEPIITTGAYSQ